MDWRLAFAPLYAAGLGALVLAAFTFGRREARSFTPRGPLAWFALLAVLYSLVALRYGTGPFTWVSLGALGHGMGAGLLVGAAGLAAAGSRVRVRADALKAEAPRGIDEGVAALRQGQVPHWGVYRGRLAASDSVTSPGGVVCAFYEAEVRARRADGGKGSLLSVERAYAPLLQVKGEKAEAALSFSPRLLLAPQRTRPCLLGLPAEAGAANVPAEGLPPEEALSYERVGKLGEECLVVGELRPGPVPGVYELRGRQGGPAMVILGNQGETTGSVLTRRAWRLFAAAGGLTVAAAWVFAS
ncbi:hypothetical protein [Melittangium boletus]|uniref:Uncharacterized protein n=1 Tax=Melittangium boletus DSM 14713 TaxID=1294270 RepID=A0A250IRZ8_9BACT|nr:hypothetical protein [Melittangium boletus]ATB34023.1 hypothetical protein MEBOL_007524 [Melittangium boletus DSM 14713]